MAISKQTIDEVRARADIVTEIGSRIELKKSGANHSGLCPFHGEKTPSFSVTASKQFFHCFGCGKNGDIIQFLMDHDGMQFHEAVKDLAERLGVKVEEDQDEQSVRKSQETRRVASTLEDLCETAATFYQESLTKSPEAQAYVTTDRGLSAEVMATYGIGYAPNVSSRKALASVFPDYSLSQGLLDAGLVADKEDDVNKRYDRFRDRLMFPIRDPRGRCIGFGGRIINGNVPKAPKYLNSPETPIFLKHKVLYGLHEARSHIMRSKEAFVSEGYMDVVGMAQYGIGNAVAALGTALTEDHVRLLLRFTDQVCFMFDGDEPGQKAAWKSLRVVLPLLEPRHSYRFLTLPDNTDPDEYLRQHGKEQFLQLAKAAPTLSQYLTRSLLRDFGEEGRLITAEAKTRFVVAGEELCDLIPESNPLKGMLLQEIDTLVGRAPRAIEHPSSGTSPADRLRHATAGGATDVAPKRPWLSKEEWIKTRPDRAGGPYQQPTNRSSSMAQAVAPQLNRKSLWQRLTEAVVASPDTASLIAERIVPMLDPESPEEQALILAFSQSEDMPSRPERYAADQLQAAVDLLNQAQPTILKLRQAEVRAELKRMRDQDEISEEAYIEHMMKV